MAPADPPPSTSSGIPPAEVERVCREADRLLDRVRQDGAASADALLASIDSCPCGVIVADDDARIVVVNGVASDIIGLPTRELQSLSIWDVSHTTSEYTFEVLWEAFKNAGRQQGVYSLRHAAGHPIEVAYCAVANLAPGYHASIVGHPLA